MEDGCSACNEVYFVVGGVKDVVVEGLVFAIYSRSKHSELGGSEYGRFQEKGLLASQYSEFGNHLNLFL